ncbi:hypothetical protein BD779DRAFT_134385 [Infundibulicybe gibba]|nr:hypothetical protein BD779DRAFT_134385 [Infundibulicybe gibba]
MMLPNISVADRQPQAPSGQAHARPQPQHLQADQQASQQRLAFSARQMSLQMSYANFSAPELRNHGVSEKVIEFVESRRAVLQCAAHDQGVLRGQLRSLQSEQNLVSARSPLGAPVTQQGASPLLRGHPGLLSKRMARCHQISAWWIGSHRRLTAKPSMAPTQPLCDGLAGSGVEVVGTPGVVV